MATPSQRAYVVVPFERVGVTIGPRTGLIFEAVAQAKLAAQQLAARVPGIAILERELDPETGDGRDTLLAEYGAVPPHFPESVDWTFKLN